eukprot:366188-Chlamydomonas_euryale.AAC.4
MFFLSHAECGGDRKGRGRGGKGAKAATKSKAAADDAGRGGEGGLRPSREAPFTGCCLRSRAPPLPEPRADAAPPLPCQTAPHLVARRNSTLSPGCEMLVAAAAVTAGAAAAWASAYAILCRNRRRCCCNACCATSGTKGWIAHTDTLRRMVGVGCAPSPTMRTLIRSRQTPNGPH